MVIKASCELVSHNTVLARKYGPGKTPGNGVGLVFHATDVAETGASSEDGDAKIAGGSVA